MSIPGIAPLRPEEVAELTAVQRLVPHLRERSLSQIAAEPVLLGCLRNVAKARREALAARRRRGAANDTPFQLTP